MDRLCVACGGPIAEGKKQSAKYCTKKCGKAYYQRANHERARLANRKSYHLHRESRRASANDPAKAERKRKYAEAYRAKHRDRMLAKDRAYAESHREQRRANMVKYNARPERKLHTHLWRRTSKKQRVGMLSQGFLLRTPSRDLLIEQIDPVDVFNRDGWKCQLCGVDLVWPEPGVKRSTRRNSPTVDHIHPVALGGKHEMANVRSACVGCNLSQGGPVGSLRRKLLAASNASA
jgi:hypothetical protein